MELAVAGKVEHRSSALRPEPRHPRLDRVGAESHPVAVSFARSIARHTFSGVHGGSISVIPRGASASSTALTTAGVEPMVALSPTPLTPSGLIGLGVMVRSSVKLGRSGAGGTM